MARKYYSSEARSQAMRERKMIAIIAMALGLAIGGIIALLFAPESGEELREDLGEYAEDALKSGRKTASRLGNNLHDAREAIEDRVR